MWKKNEPALPPGDTFFSHLNNEPYSDAEYPRALDVWRTFKCTTLHQYLEL